MTTAFTTTARAMWALGDYHRLALSTGGGLGRCWSAPAGFARDNACSTWPQVQATSRFARPAPGLW